MATLSSFLDLEQLTRFFWGGALSGVQGTVPVDGAPALAAFLMDLTQCGSSASPALV